MKMKTERWWPFPVVFFQWSGQFIGNLLNSVQQLLNGPLIWVWRCVCVCASARLIGPLVEPPV